jgi:Do/DeqQ family serine protease
MSVSIHRYREPGATDARLAATFLFAFLLALAPCGPLAAQEGEPGSRRTPVVEVVERLSPAVVNISTDIYESRPANPFFGMHRDPLFDEFFNRFFGPQREMRQHRRSLGSGVLVDRRGHILTNHHVILRASEIHVTLVSGEEYDGALVGSDPGSDLAVVKIDLEEEIEPAGLGTSSDLMIGESVIAIGNPFGLSHTVTTGVISALNRSIQAGEQVFKDFIQTDASINPGNSGGPLLNIRGEVIGVNTAIYSEAQGIGFAIPVDRVRRIMDDLIAFGEVQAAWFGLEVQALDEKLAAYLEYEGTAGVLVTEIYPGSPSAKAGLKVQDILVQADGTELTSPDVFGEIVRRMTVNDEIEFRVFRKGRFHRKRVTSVALPEAMAENFCQRSLGIRVGELTNRAMIRSGIQGVEITDVTRGSQADQVGLQPGDVLLKINDTSIPNVQEFRKAFSKLRCRSHITLQVLRGRFLYYVTLKLRASRS